MPKKTIKAQGTIKPTPQGTAHIPNIIRKELEIEEIPFIADAHTVILFNPNREPSEIIKSLEILIEDIKLRTEPNKEK